MQAVKTKDTGPEWIVRRILFSLGFRYRLHRKGLPGRPDIAFPGLKKAIFVHGCFWHSHDCRKGRAPKSRLDYWTPKLEANKDRDARHSAALADAGWSVLTVWQCEINDREALRERLIAFLDDGSNRRSTL